MRNSPDRRDALSLINRYQIPTLRKTIHVLRRHKTAISNNILALTVRPISGKIVHFQIVRWGEQLHRARPFQVVLQDGRGGARAVQSAPLAGIAGSGGPGEGAVGDRAREGGTEDAASAAPGMPREESRRRRWRAAETRADRPV